MEKKLVGIYKITNKNNGKFYIGSSNNIIRRWRKHKRLLNNQKHPNIILQNSWNKHGSNNFIFEVIEILFDINNLISREQYYLDNLLPFENVGYNICKIAGGGDTLTNNPKKDVIKKQISESMKKMWAKKTPEEIKKYKDMFSGENNPGWKGGPSFKHCECGKKIDNKNKTCRQCLDYNGEKNPFFGKKWSEEQKKHLSDIKKGTYFGVQNKSIIIDNVEYFSLGDAELKLNIKKLTIRYRVNSNNFKNYYYKTHDDNVK